MFLEIEGHLSSKCGIAWTAFMLDGLLVHADGGTALEPAGPALVPVGLIDNAGTLGLGLAHVLSVTANGTLEKKMKIEKLVSLFKP